jgi:hypothetical protein
MMDGQDISLDLGFFAPETEMKGLNTEMSIHLIAGLFDGKSIIEITNAKEID